MVNLLTATHKGYTMKLPQFSNINIDLIADDLKKILDNNREKIQSLLNKDQHNWDSLMCPLEDCDEQLSHFWSRISHLHAVADNPSLRNQYDDCLPQLSLYHSEISQNKKLYDSILTLKKTDYFNTLLPEQQKVIDNTIRDFELSGVHLKDSDKKKLQELLQSLSQACNQFEKNILDATTDFHLDIDDPKELDGLPKHTLLLAQHRGEQANKKTHRFTIDGPTYVDIITHAKSSSLRETIYHAYVTRASDQGPSANTFNNQKLMEKIISLRMSIAQLVGFSHYAEYSLSTKMLKQPQQVLGFLNKLAKASRNQASDEYQKLCEFSKNQLQINTPQAWDIAYISEQYRRHLFDISDDQLRPYFSLENVIHGLFNISQKLFGFTIKSIDKADTWHNDVRAYELVDSNNKRIACFYMDLLTRPTKRGGAWMDDCQSRRLLSNGDIQIPIAFVNTNFPPAIANQPILLTHNDVITLFHEFGHALQHMLTTIDYVDVAGINGVPWDAVEVASQWMENFAWDKQCLAMFAHHYQSGEPLPDSLYQKMKNARHFNTGMRMMRQLEFALFDFHLHMGYQQDKDNYIQCVLDDIRAKFCVTPIPAFNRFQHSFSHIFSGGYAAGYYSYKWAEVMAQDAFSVFVDHGIFNSKISKRFRDTFLAQGGAREPMDLFMDFCGRQPSVDALLRHAGIQS